MPDRIAGLLEQAEGLTKSVDALDKSVKTLRHDQRIIKAIVAVLGALVAFVAFVALVAWQANTTAARNEQNARIACEVSNQARAAQIQLWDYILTQSSPQAPTAAQRRQIAQFRAYLNTTFAQRDCEHPTSPAPSSPLVSPTR